MSVINFTAIVNFSADHPVNKVQNLLPGNSGKWTCPNSFNEKSIDVELSLPPCYIEGIDIGNYGSASLEIEVKCQFNKNSHYTRQVCFLTEFWLPNIL